MSTKAAAAALAGAVAGTAVAGVAVAAAAVAGTAGVAANYAVKRGRITFDAEGNDIEKSKYFSRIIHWPGNGLSGVTIGRGYDMGNRTKAVVKQDMMKAGIPSDKAEALSEGAGLKGTSKNRYFRQSGNSNLLIFQVPNLRKLYFSRCP